MFAASDGALRPAAPEAVVQGEHFRFTVLTSRLLRLELNVNGEFVDEGTAVVTNRSFPVPEFDATRDGDFVTIRTEHVELTYDGRPFSAASLAVRLVSATDHHYSTWRFGQKLPSSLPFRGDLPGTARTLDDVDGECPLEPSILSTYGFATLDDSTSVRLTSDGWIAPRTSEGHDVYLFAHGRDYQGALDDYFTLTGPPALVPRYVLGNWWSRYWKYDADEYLALMDDFARQRIPFSVAVVDMDWHLTDIDPALGTGWTGYTWNRDLFPDPPSFLSALHDRGLAVTLNTHPADGIRAHEDAYPAVARAMGVDPASGKQIPFDITSRRFVDTYLKDVHHPLEAEGVYFWWLDWQSGGHTSIHGLDPLWMLNHVHYTDSGRGGHRPLTFSRYSGPGSHRYPVGFSGDTIATWDSLDFQPYFTAAAANIGFYWWSHDIGGHMFGARDPELAARWFQFGALSPVNRLHSSPSPFMSKEPAHLGPEAGPVAGRFLRLRHVLVPYLYTAAWRAHADGIAIVRPLYHEHPNTSSAHAHRNSYLLGADLFVAPITTPADPVTRLAAATAWLPEGSWTDLFTGAVYRGGRTVTFHRPLEQYPVLARAGAVVPLAGDAMAPVAANPANLVLRVVPGDGTSTLLEDDHTAAPTPWRTTAVQTVTPGADGRIDLRIELSTQGPETERPLASLSFDLAGIAEVSDAALLVEGVAHPLTEVPGDDDAADLLAPALRLRASDVDLHAGIVLTVTGATRRQPDHAVEIFAILQEARIEYALKDAAWAAAQTLTPLELAAELVAIGLPAALRDAIGEVLAIHGSQS